MVRGVRRYGSSIGRLRLAIVFWIAALSVGTGAGWAQDYKVDAGDSQSLTTYLRQHRLPLVGAQVLSDTTGNRRIVLYGFVATELGKNDAANKALAYIENGARAGTPAPQLENRIEIRPELTRMKAQGTTAIPASSNESLDQILDDIDRFGVKMVPEVGPK